jgi:hypothetical protein
MLGEHVQPGRDLGGDGIVQQGPEPRDYTCDILPT